MKEKIAIRRGNHTTLGYNNVCWLISTNYMWQYSKQR